MASESLVGASWVLLSYRLPRVPSSPRVAVWRRLQSLGVAQLGDGLVALPADARTKEHLEWAAADIEEHGGTVTVWLGRPGSAAAERRIIAGMRDDRRAEYETILNEAADARGLEDPARTRAARRLQKQYRIVARRDYFPPAERTAAREAVKALLGSAQTAPVVPAGEGASW